jgi:hypothetical protein
MLNIFYFLVFFLSFYDLSAYAKTCEPLTFEIGHRSPCRGIQVLSYRDGYQHCKDLHWRNFAALDTKFKNLQKDFTSKNLSVKECQTVLENVFTDFKRSERQLRIVTKSLQTNVKMLNMVKEKKENLKKILDEISKWQEDKIIKNMQLFSLIEFFIIKQDEESINKLDVDISVKMIIYQVISKIRDSGTEEPAKIEEILTIFDGMDTLLVLSKSSAAFILKLRNYFELRKDFTQSEINFQAYTNKMNEELLNAENEESTTLADLDDAKEEMKISESDVHEATIKKNTKENECSSKSSELNEILKTKNQVESDRRGSKNAHDVMCEDVYTECRWNCRSSKCDDETIKKYNCI